MDGTTSTALDNVMGVIPKVFELAGTCINAVLDNPILLLFFSVSMIGIGLGVFKKMKRASGGN